MHGQRGQRQYNAAQCGPPGGVRNAPPANHQVRDSRTPPRDEITPVNDPEPGSVEHFINSKPLLMCRKESFRNMGLLEWDDIVQAYPSEVPDVEKTLVEDMEAMTSHRLTVGGARLFLKEVYKRCTSSYVTPAASLQAPGSGSTPAEGPLTSSQIGVGATPYTTGDAGNPENGNEADVEDPARNERRGRARGTRLEESIANYKQEYMEKVLAERKIIAEDNNISVDEVNEARALASLEKQLDYKMWVRVDSLSLTRHSKKRKSEELRGSQAKDEGCSPGVSYFKVDGNRYIEFQLPEESNHWKGAYWCKICHTNEYWGRLNKCFQANLASQHGQSKKHRDNKRKLETACLEDHARDELEGEDGEAAPAGMQDEGAGREGGATEQGSVD